MIPFFADVLDYLDFEYRWPLLAGDKEPVVLGIVGDSIENGFGIDHLIGRQQSGEVDPGDYVSIARRNPRDHIRMPDVRVNLAFDELKFVQLVDDLAPVFHENVTRFPKGIGIAKAQGGSAIAGDELFRRASHAPTFSCVRELLHRLQAEAVVDETDVRCLCPLVDVRPPVDDPLAEIFRRKTAILQRLSCFRIDNLYG
jgi:hypothetical protein